MALKFLDEAGLSYFWSKLKTLLAGKVSKTDIVAATDSEIDTILARYEVSDVPDINTVLAHKADIDGNYSDMAVGTAGQLQSTAYSEDTTPYLFRSAEQAANGSDRKRMDAIVGGSLVVNQRVNIPSASHTETKNGVTLTDNRDGTYLVSTATGGATAATYFLMRGVSMPVVKDHKYYYRGTPKGGSATTYRSYIIQSVENKNDYGDGCIQNATANGTNTACVIAYLVKGTVITTPILFKPQVTDLTAEFGSAIADYIYGLEQAHAGAGTAFLRELFPEDYYAYNVGTLTSVEGVSAHVTRNADGDVIGNYPLDESVSLRGVPKLVDGKLTYDGDRYLPDGTIERRYGLRAYQSGDESLTDAITDQTNTVYKLSTPFTETAAPYQSLQICDPEGTEEFVSTGMVPIGHETRYSENLRAKIEGLPWDFSTLIAPTEKTYKATKNYTVGELLIVNNTLYKVTANIANDGNIIPNTNVTAKPLSQIIAELA